VVLAGAVPKEKGAGVGVGALSVFCPKEKGEGFVVEFCPNDEKDEGEEEGLFGRGIEEGFDCCPKLKLVLVEGLLRVLEFIDCPKLLNRLLFVAEELGILVPKLNVDEGVLNIEVVVDAAAVGLLFPKPKGEAGIDEDGLGFVVEEGVLNPKLLLPKL